MGRSPLLLPTEWAHEDELTLARAWRRGAVPEVLARCVARLRTDLPHAEITELPDCGHLVQEDAPEQVGALLAGFFAAERRVGDPVAARRVP